jgi:hypothetical protein
MNAGYMFVYNEAFKPLAKVVERGLKAFSAYPFQSVYVNEPDLVPVCYQKLVAAANSPFDLTVFMDADVVPTRNIDDLIELGLSSSFTHPLLPRHLNNYTPNGVSATEKIMPYGQSCVMILNQEAKKHLLTALPLIHANLQDMSLMCYADEGEVNKLLWRDGVTKQLNYCCPPAMRYLTWRRGEPLTGYSENPLITYPLFHAEKNPATADEILTDLMALDTHWTEKTVILDYCEPALSVSS